MEAAEGQKSGRKHSFLEQEDAVEKEEERQSQNSAPDNALQKQDS